MTTPATPVTTPKQPDWLKDGRTYQTASPAYQLVVDNDQNENQDITVLSGGSVSFTPQKERLTDLIFGEFNTGNPQILDRFNVKEIDPKTKRERTRKIKPHELAAMIENSKAFKDCQAHNTIGARGIWLKADREKWLKEQAVGSAEAPDESAVLGKLSNTVLISIIEEAKGTYAPKADRESAEAFHARLVKVACALQEK